MRLTENYSWWQMCVAWKRCKSHTIIWVLHRSLPRLPNFPRHQPFSVFFVWSRKFGGLLRAFHAPSLRLFVYQTSLGMAALQMKASKPAAVCLDCGSVYRIRWAAGVCTARVAKKAEISLLSWGIEMRAVPGH